MIHRILRIILCNTFLISFTFTLHADNTELNREREMEVFLDAIIRVQMREYNIPGATLQYPAAETNEQPDPGGD